MRSVEFRSESKGNTQRRWENSDEWNFTRGYFDHANVFLLLYHLESVKYFVGMSTVLCGHCQLHS